MDWKDFRLTKRLELKPPIVEEVYRLIAEVDAIKTSWHLTGKLLPQTIERLTHSVIVTSTGSSNRIEGNHLSDKEVEALYRNIRIKKFRTRDEQEVGGYLEMLELVFNNYEDIALREGTILQMHHDMLKYSEKDERHKGLYKFGSNRVEARDRKGKVVGIIFEPTPPYLVQKEMSELVNWYQWGIKSHHKHPLIWIANFIFEYLAIHPFQDGNGRTSRLLTNLLLLQQGYHFASVVSHERLIEAHKAEYYLALNKTQKTWKKKREDITPWLLYFLKIMQAQAKQALKILEGDNIEYLLSEKQLELWRWASALTTSEFTRKSAIQALQFSPRTIESIIQKLINMKKLERIGQGRAVRYRVVRS